VKGTKVHVRPLSGEIPGWEGGQVGGPEPEDLSNQGSQTRNIFRGGKMKKSYLSGSSSYRVFFILIVCFYSSISFLFVPKHSISADNQSILDEIVVTASRFDEKITNVPANITVINEERIRNSTAQNIPDLLRTEGGILVSDIAGNRRFYNVDIRGFGENGALNTLVLIDGRRVNQTDLSGTDWAQISLDRVQRVEIIRGGRGSVLYGDNATGGVINIITKEGDKLKAGTELAAGSYSTYRVNAYAGGSVVNTLPFYVSGNYMASGGYRDNSNQDTKDAGMNLSFLGIKDLKINFAAGYHKDSSRLPGALKESDFAKGLPRTATTQPDNYANTEDYYFKVTPEYFINNNIALKMDMSYRNRTFVSYYFYDAGNFTGSSGIQTVAFSPRATFRTKLTRDISNNLIAGADYQRAAEDIRNTSLFFGFFSAGDYRLRKTNYGAYIYDEIAVSKRLFLSAGYRRDRAEYSFSPSSPEKIAMQADAYTAGINYIYLNRSYLYLTYSRSFRYPVMDELYSFYTNTINTGLKNQTSDVFELGTRFYFTDSIYLQAGLFRTDTRQEIIYNPVTYNNENLEGIARRSGAELSAVAMVTDEILFRGSYTFTDATIRGGMFDGRRIPNVPENRATLEGQYSPFKGFTAALNGTYVGERPFISDFANDFSKQKSFYVINNKYKYKWKNMTVFLDINNITNQKYSEYGVKGGFPLEKAYYPSPGINFLSGFSIEL
jgi:iron complex outermembrane recepter protein